MANPQAQSRMRFDSLQAGRGLAALAVLFFHVWLLARDKLDRTFLGELVMHGARGVDFFFVLSGFIIFYANRASIGKPASAPRYFYRRLVRVYPIFLVVFLVKLSYVLAGGGGVPDSKTNLSYILCSALLIPQTDWPFLAVSWTLCFEILFYTIFLLVILFGKSMRWWLLAHALLCFGLNLPFLPPLEYPVNFLFHTQTLDFYLGALAAYLCLHKHVSPKTAYALLVSGVVALWAVYYFNPFLEPTLRLTGPLVWGLSFFLLITGLAALEQHGHFKVPRWLAYLGDASYSVYLVHNNVILIGGGLIARRLPQVDNYLTLVLLALAAAALVAGILCYQFIERPMLNWFHRRGPR